MGIAAGSMVILGPRPGGDASDDDASGPPDCLVRAEKRLRKVVTSDKSA